MTNSTNIDCIKQNIDKILNTSNYPNCKWIFLPQVSIFIRMTLDNQQLEKHLHPLTLISPLYIIGLCWWYDKNGTLQSHLQLLFSRHLQNNPPESVTTANIYHMLVWQLDCPVAPTNLINVAVITSVYDHCTANTDHIKHTIDHEYSNIDQSVSDLFEMANAIPSKKPTTENSS